MSLVQQNSAKSEKPGLDVERTTKLFGEYSIPILYIVAPCMFTIHLISYIYIVRMEQYTLLYYKFQLFFYLQNA